MGSEPVHKCPGAADLTFRVFIANSKTFRESPVLGSFIHVGKDAGGYNV